MASPIKTAKQMFDQFLSKHDPATGDLSPSEVRPLRAKKAASALAAKGGVARAVKLTPKKRQEIAKRAAKARWKNPRA